MKIRENPHTKKNNCKARYPMTANVGVRNVESRPF